MKKIALLLALVTLLSTFSLVACNGNKETEKEKEPLPVVVDPIDDNYRTFYQIFVGSFSDGNNDGMGDLQGIINRMDYLNDGDINSGNDLGIQGIWLSPIFSSPTYHKYDTKDYYTIDKKFGTEETLIELIELCHERNVKVILDLVLNHTSTQHPWFVEFKKARMNGDTANKYYDYYSCVREEDKETDITYQKIPNVDWWYECNFSSEMPELNFDNPQVKTEMLDVARYYLDLGVDGFRFDAIKYIYFGDTPSSVEFWEWYMDILRSEYPEIYTIGECWSADSEVVRYVGATNCFNFSMSSAEGKVAMAAKGKNNIATFLNYVVSYKNMIEKQNPDAMMISFLSNHDQDRIAGAFVTENFTKMAANLYLLCSGSPMIYYGEELGVRGKRGTELTDANRRLKMLWGDGDTVRNPVGACYPAANQITTTVVTQLEDENSILNHYSKVIAIRHKYPAIARGDYSAVTSDNKNLGGFLVAYEGEQLVILHNTSSSPITYDLTALEGLEGITLTQLCDYVGCGDVVINGTTITIGGNTSAIIK